MNLLFLYASLHVYLVCPFYSCHGLTFQQPGALPIDETL